jgi:hypothetical protein
MQTTLTYNEYVEGDHLRVCECGNYLFFLSHSTPARAAPKAGKKPELM